MSRAGWIVAAVMVAAFVAVMMWPKPPAPPTGIEALQAENDSLRAAIEARDMRIQLLSERTDSLANVHDSLLAAMPSERVRYLRAREDLRYWSTDRLWMFMGQRPVDTIAP